MDLVIQLMVVIGALMVVIGAMVLVLLMVIKAAFFARTSGEALGWGCATLLIVAIMVIAIFGSKGSDKEQQKTEQTKGP